MAAVRFDESPEALCSALGVELDRATDGAPLKPLLEEAQRQLAARDQAGFERTLDDIEDILEALLLR